VTGAADATKRVPPGGDADVMEGHAVPQTREDRGRMSDGTLGATPKLALGVSRTRWEPDAMGGGSHTR